MPIISDYRINKTGKIVRGYRTNWTKLQILDGRLIDFSDCARATL